MTAIIKQTTLKLTEEQLAFIIKSLKKHKRVRILNLGTFTVRKIPAKKMYNVIVGKDIVIPARKRIGFTAFDSVAKQIN